MKEKNIFKDYLYINKNSENNCIRNYKERKLVFFEEINGEKYFIKKYIPKKRHQFKIALGIKEDPAIHCKKICEELEKVGIPCIQPYFVEVYKKSFFKRSSIFVTKDGGEPLENYLYKFEEYKEYFDYFFDTFLHLIENKIYCTDYNLGGILVGKDNTLRLIDLDSYRKKRVLTSSYKKYIIYNLKKQAYTNKIEYRKYDEYAKEKVEEIIKKLKWEKFI